MWHCLHISRLKSCPVGLNRSIEHFFHIQTLVSGLTIKVLRSVGENRSYSRSAVSSPAYTQLPADTSIFHRGWEQSYESNTTGAAVSLTRSLSEGKPAVLQFLFQEERTFPGPCVAGGAGQRRRRGTPSPQLSLPPSPRLKAGLCWSAGRLSEAGLAAPGCHAEMHHMGPPKCLESSDPRASPAAPRAAQGKVLVWETTNQQNALSKKILSSPQEKNKIKKSPTAHTL